MSADTMRRMVSPLPQKPTQRSSSSHSVNGRDRVGGPQPSSSSAHPQDRLGALKGTPSAHRSSSTPPAVQSSPSGPAEGKKKKRSCVHDPTPLETTSPQRADIPPSRPSSPHPPVIPDKQVQAIRDGDCEEKS